MPKSKSSKRYANVGKTEWHEGEKVLVRRTGDYVLAAVDRSGLYASNNFFVVLPKEKCSLDLDGLCALLNSRPMTWYFRAIEPRRGRVFAELKIKHLAAFPLPQAVVEADGCRELNELGRERAAIAAKTARVRTPHEVEKLKRSAAACDAAIDAAVRRLLPFPPLADNGDSQTR